MVHRVLVVLLFFSALSATGKESISVSNDLLIRVKVLAIKARAFSQKGLFNAAKRPYLFEYAIVEGQEVQMALHRTEVHLVSNEVKIAEEESSPSIHEIRGAQINNKIRDYKAFEKPQICFFIKESTNRTVMSTKKYVAEDFCLSMEEYTQVGYFEKVLEGPEGAKVHIGVDISDFDTPDKQDLFKERF